jgi:hypothetical protein
MRTIDVPVNFKGAVRVAVPDHLADADARLLAQLIAGARILATCDNPDAPEEDAFENYSVGCSDAARSTAEVDWDKCLTDGVGGAWYFDNEA